MIVSRALTIAAYGLAAAGFGVLAHRARRPGARLPTFSAVCGFALAYRVGRVPVGRIVVLAFWWWAGWHFFAR